MKKEVFMLKMWLLEQHSKADDLLRKGQLQCYGPDGKKTGWEFDKVQHYQYHKDYIGLGMYHIQRDTSPIWKEAYRQLVDEGLLERCPTNPGQYRLIPVYADEMEAIITASNIDLTPSVPIKLQDEYKKYMKSDEWKARREKRMDMDNHECQDCGSKLNLVVHHKSYDNLFNEPMEDLITVCDECHAKRHNR